MLEAPATAPEMEPAAQMVQASPPGYVPGDAAAQVPHHIDAHTVHVVADGSEDKTAVEPSPPATQPNVRVVVGELALEPAATPAGQSVSLEQHLCSLGIPSEACSGYAATLYDDGYENVAMFEGLTLEELRDEYGFKKGHLRAIERSRSVESAAASPASGRDPAEP